MAHADIMGYADLINAVATDLKMPRHKVRKVLEASQRHTVEFLAKTPGNRVRFGRLATFFSRKTSDRTVNHPQKPGEHVFSPAHVVGRAAFGTKAIEALNGAKWLDKDDEPIPAAEAAEQAQEAAAAA